MFLCGPELFKRLESAKKDGNCSLSDGMRQLAQERKLKAFDVGDGHWQDVDTHEAFAYTQRIFESDFRESPLLQRFVHAYNFATCAASASSSFDLGEHRIR